MTKISRQHHDIFELELFCLTLERSNFVHFRGKLEHSARPINSHHYTGNQNTFNYVIL